MKKLLILIPAILLSINIKAQQDSTRLKKDSVKNERLESQLIKIKQLSADRTRDSLRRAELEKQVAQLSNADNLKKTTLLAELTKLKQKDSVRMANQKRQVDSLRRYVTGFPVAPFRDTLFLLFTRQGSFSAQERAEAINKRIDKLADDFTFKLNSLKLIPSENTVDVVFKDRLLISISDEDALWQNTSKTKLAQTISNKIAHAIVDYQSETRWQTLLKEGLLAILVLSIVILLLYSINRLFRWINVKVRRQKGWLSGGIRIKNYELLQADKQVYILSLIITFIKWVAILIVIYLALPILFGIFPFTRNLSNLLLGYITSPLKKIGLSVWDYIPNFITIVVLVTIFRYVLRLLRYIKTEIEIGRLTINGFYPDWANPTYQIVRVLILAFMLIVIFPYLPGSDSAVFKGVSVFMGVLFTFGSAGALGNIVAGLVMTYMRSFKIGDRVKIGEATGDIIEKTLLVTRIRTIQNEIISIPNSTVMNNHTVNYSSEAETKGLIVNTTVTIGYDAPWRQVHQLLIDAALATPMIDKEPLPYVLQVSLDDYYVSYRINAFTKQPDKQAAIYSALHANIQDKFNEAGVEIMSPHYKALRDGNATTIPPGYLPKDYIAPAFNTQQRKAE